MARITRHRPFNEMMSLREAWCLDAHPAESRTSQGSPGKGSDKDPDPGLDRRESSKYNQKVRSVSLADA
jgi:hypothetical protein